MPRTWQSDSTVIAALTSLQRQVRGRQRPLAGLRWRASSLAARARAFRQVFGVTGERDAGFVDHALRTDAVDDGVELTGHGAIDGAIDEIEHVAAVRAIEYPAVLGAPRGA